jgi:hypothetical protein
VEGTSQVVLRSIFWPVEGTSQPVTISKKRKNSQFCSAYSRPFSCTESPIAAAAKYVSMLSVQSLGERERFWHLLWANLTSCHFSLFLGTFLKNLWCGFWWGVCFCALGYMPFQIYITAPLA